MQPVLMPPNIIDHFYRGGDRLTAFRGVPQHSPRTPEEWLAATVHRAGEPEVGLSRLADGSLFAKLVEADPEGWTGFEHGGPGAGPADTGLLVKFLDAGQRLPVHVHPTRSFAIANLHSCYGKTEAWHILDVRGDDPAVWVGFREDVDERELAARVDAQDSEWLLGHMNKISVRPGDGILVPAGQPHATGAGIFLVEVQEPTDFSILLEWSVTTATRDESHLDLGFETALRGVSHRATGADELASLLHHLDPGTRDGGLLRALPAAADPFFRVDVAAPGGSDEAGGVKAESEAVGGEKVGGAKAGGEVAGGEVVSVPRGFAVAIVLAGQGELGWSGGGVAIKSGEVFAIPAGLGDWTVTGPARVAICRPGVGWPDLT
ncbi:carbohydrate kinase [Actinoplanes sp. NPDC089786]|uniref:class I mannose-6-phosphate isomerase n=1 Tax=Actinoplanes sp. NPDC089786 TaxID=3155185 RepID=UPI00342CC2E3